MACDVIESSSLSFCLSVCLSFCLSFCLSVFLFLFSSRSAKRMPVSLDGKAEDRPGLLHSRGAAAMYHFEGEA